MNTNQNPNFDRNFDVSSQNSISGLQTHHVEQVRNILGNGRLRSSDRQFLELVRNELNEIIDRAIQSKRKISEETRPDRIRAIDEYAEGITGFRDEITRKLLAGAPLRAI